MRGQRGEGAQTRTCRHFSSLLLRMRKWPLSIPELGLVGVSKPIGHFLFASASSSDTFPLVTPFSLPTSSSSVSGSNSSA